MSTPIALTRWRLVLGRYAQRCLTAPLSPSQARMAQVLDYLYQREYQGRGVRPGGRDRAGSLDPSQLTATRWLQEAKALFPKETLEVVEKHAIERYGLTELLTDADVLSRLEPNMDLLKAMLTFKGHMKGRVLEEARRIVRTVVEQVRQRLEKEIRRALTGRASRTQHSPLKVAQNFDARGTIRRNLKNYNSQLGKIIADNPLFFSRVRRHIPWDVVLCVDQSGSMVDSLVHSAVTASILAGLPIVNVKLVVFDTSVVDMTGYVSDPIEVLMGVQLGGGTDIGQAMLYCSKLISNPRRTVLVLVTDFCEGASPQRLVAVCRQLAEAGVKMIGLAALDEEATPAYDRKMAQRLTGCGMEIAALTPEHLAQWLAKIIG